MNNQLLPEVKTFKYEHTVTYSVNDKLHPGKIVQQKFESSCITSTQQLKFIEMGIERLNEHMNLYNDNRNLSYTSDNSQKNIKVRNYLNELVQK